MTIHDHKQEAAWVQPMREVVNWFERHDGKADDFGEFRFVKAARAALAARDVQDTPPERSPREREMWQEHLAAVREQHEHSADVQEEGRSPYERAERDMTADYIARVIRDELWPQVFEKVRAWLDRASPVQATGEEVERAAKAIERFIEPNDDAADVNLAATMHEVAGAALSAARREP